MSEVSIVKTRLLGSLFKKSVSRVLGHDGAYSVPLDEGRVFWSFGDTLLGSERRGYDPKKINIDDWLTKDAWVKENILMTSNSALIADTNDICTLMKTGYSYYVHQRKVGNQRLTEAREIIPVPEKLITKKIRTAFWPMDGISVDGKLYVYYLMVKYHPLVLYATGVLKSHQPYEKFTRVPSSVPISPDDILDPSEKRFAWWNNMSRTKGQEVPNFGTAVLKKVLDGFIYVYGSQVVKIKENLVHVVTLARVNKENVDDVAKYEYLTEAPSTQNNFTFRWGGDPRESVRIFDGNANEMSVSYNPYLSKYLSFYSTATILEPEIHMRFSEEPEGPWSAPIVVFKPKRSCSIDFCYAAKEHPEYSVENGKKTYLTYVSHQRYYPELLEIEFE
ncbi:MAG: DUF4185 domain-containing protein [Candidatus Bathyarchaeota archaeon]